MEKKFRQNLQEKSKHLTVIGIVAAFAATIPT